MHLPLDAKLPDSRGMVTSHVSANEIKGTSNSSYYTSSAVQGVILPCYRLGKALTSRPVGLYSSNLGMEKMR